MPQLLERVLGLEVWKQKSGRVEEVLGLLGSLFERRAPLLVLHWLLQAGTTQSLPPLQGEFGLIIEVKMKVYLVVSSAAFEDHKKKTGVKRWYGPHSYLISFRVLKMKTGQKLTGLHVQSAAPPQSPKRRHLEDRNKHRPSLRRRFTRPRKTADEK